MAESIERQNLVESIFIVEKIICLCGIIYYEFREMVAVSLLLYQ